MAAISRSPMGPGRDPMKKNDEGLRQRLVNCGPRCLFLVLCATSILGKTVAKVSKTLDFCTDSATGAFVQAEYSVSGDIALTERSRQRYAILRPVNGASSRSEGLE
jgi:hypothetical protein